MSYAVRPLALPEAPSARPVARWGPPAAIAALGAVLLSGAVWCVYSVVDFSAFLDSRLSAGILYCAEPPRAEPLAGQCHDHACFEREAHLLMERQKAAVNYELRCNSHS